MPKELVDQDGRVAWSAAHSAWGKVVETWRDPLSGRGRRERLVESPFRLLGQYEDGDAGLCYARYRWFDSETGRWCSPDPFGIVGGRNLLAWDGSPTREVDPLGLCAEEGAYRDDHGKLHNPDGKFAFDGGEKSRASGSDHGNTAGEQPATLYARFDSEGNFLKYGISQDPETRYSDNELEGGEVKPLQTGPRFQMLAVERYMVEMSRGQLSRESWKGARLPK